MNGGEEDEIKRLRRELKALQDMFRQLTEEEKDESYDVRRSKILKAQVTQLERQCMLLSDALSSRASVMVKTENELISVIEMMQDALAQDKPGPTVAISRKQLVSHIEEMQKLKGSMQRQSILSGAENLQIPQLSGLKFCRSDNISCLDVCSGQINHLNLQHVAYLESKLVDLQSRLMAYQTSLQSTFVKRQYANERSSFVSQDDNDQRQGFSEKYLFSAGFKKLICDTEACVHEIEECSQDLLALSLLYPSAPWSVTKTPSRFGLFEVNSILRSFPANLQRNKDVKSIIIALCRAHSYISHVNEMRFNSVKREVNYCSQVNATYAHYMNCLLDGVKGAYSACETNLSKMISEPLIEILDSWSALKANQSETTMRELMSCLKRNENTLSRLIEKISAPDNDSNAVGDSPQPGLKVLETFGAELTERIELLKRQCVKESSQHQIEIDDYTHRNENDVIERLKNMLHMNKL